MNDEPELSLDEVGERVRKDAKLIGDALRREANHLRSAAGRFIEDHPYQAVGAAFAIGFLLSGGLISRTTWRSLGIASRFVVGRLARELLGASGLAAILSGADGGSQPIEQ